ncbi:hypothetical protein ACFL51_00430, partial [Myxococcota bacterium]
PWSVTRVEQRIGRLDRFGRRGGYIRHRVIVPDDDDPSPWQAWFDLMAEGFGIFHRPTSDIQFAIDSIEADVRLAFLDLGPDGLRQQIEVVRTRLAEERDRIDNQAALDAEILRSDGGMAFVDRILDLEDDGSEIEAAFNGWLNRAMKFRRSRSSDPSMWSLSRNTLVPYQLWEDLLKVDLYPQQVTYRRTRAVRRPDVVLVRPGSPLADVTHSMLRWDDRGTAFATWRVVPGMGGFDDAWAGFKLCFVVEPFDEGMSDLLKGEHHGPWRRASALLRPFTEELVIGADLRTEESALILQSLEIPYDKHEIPRRDYNLGSRWPVVEELLGPGRIQEICREVRTHAEGLLRGAEKFRDRMQDAERRLEDELDRNRRRREALAHREPESMNSKAIDRENEVDEMIAKAVREPKVRLDAMGLFVCCGEPPPYEEPR